MADRVKLAPNIFAYPDYEHRELHMEISLGGVKREDRSTFLNRGLRIRKSILHLTRVQGMSTVH